jgi:hypothetical protein
MEQGSDRSDRSNHSNRSNRSGVCELCLINVALLCGLVAFACGLGLFMRAFASNTLQGSLSKKKVVLIL